MNTDHDHFAIMCDHVGQGQLIRSVRHDASVEPHDSGWLFHCGQEQHDPDKALVVLLEEAFAMDPTLAELKDLPEGYWAYRLSRGGTWHREPYQMEDG